MGLTVGLNLFKKVLFKVNGGRKIAREVSNKPARMTRTMTDPVIKGLITLEREITYGGKEALARVEKVPNLNGSTTKLTIRGGGDNDICRTKTITREKGAGVFGGDRITVEKKYTKDWCHSTDTKLVKEYSKDGTLEHKELSYHKNVGNEKFTSHNATQDRVYNEHPLTGSMEDMLTSPDEHRYIMASLDKKNNYYRFATEGTNYEKAVASKKQAAVEAKAAKEAAEKAAKEAAEKGAAELKATQPRINISKVFNKDINELTMKERKLANGTIERSFSDPETGNVMAKTEDLGKLHKEWIYGGKADMIYMKQYGNESPYIVAKKGNYTQVKSSTQDAGGRFIISHDQYYYDGRSALKRGCDSSRPYPASAKGKVTVYDNTAEARRAEYPSLAKKYPDEYSDYPRVPIRNGKAVESLYQNCLTNAQRQANFHMRELDRDAERNFVNLNDLYSDYKK